MTQTESEMLQGLEHLMDEFYNPTTSNDRKKGIEGQLNKFSQERDSWKLCIYFVKQSNNSYVLMYALYQLELVIMRQWDLLDDTERMFLKDSVYSLTFAPNNALPNFIRNKLAKVSVEVAKHSWPKYYYEIYNAILQLLQNEQGQLAGLILLRTTSEEILNPTTEVSLNHKDSMTVFCEEHIPQIFQILTVILESLSTRRRRLPTATPPPSPSNASQTPSLLQQLSVVSFRPDSREVSREVLNTFQHLFSWVNLLNVPHYTLNSIFKYTNTSGYAQDDDDMCILAMSVLNELLYRKLAPPGTHQLFVELYQHTVVLLRDISNPSNNKIDTLSTEFIDKLTEMLSLFVEQHLWRLELQPNFSAIDFLGHFFALTMHLPTVECYLQCLSVWTTFMIQMKPQNAHKYSQALIELVISVLSKLQLANNFAQLKELNDTELNDNNETEWQIFQNTSIEVIAQVAEYAPVETFNRVLVPWNALNSMYLMLFHLDRSNMTLKLDAAERQRLHCVLTDFATLTQTLARLSNFFLDQSADYYESSMTTIKDLLTSLVDGACMSNVVGFYHLKTSDTRIIRDFTNAHSQILTALKTWCPWYMLQVPKDSYSLNRVINNALPLVRTPDMIPPQVLLSSAHVILHITSFIHPPDFIQNSEVFQLYQSVSTLPYPKNQCRDVLLCALATLLVKPWGELNMADGQARHNLTQHLFGAISEDYRHMTQYNTDGQRAQEIVDSCLPCFINIIDICKEYPTASKKIVFFALKPTIDHTMAIFTGFSKCPKVFELQLQFFIKVLDVLQPQMGSAAVEKAVDVFLKMAMREHQEKRFSGLDMLLKIFQLIIEAHGTSYKNFMQGILELCMRNIYPVLIQQANEFPDAVIALINLLHSILLNRWNYFYVTQVRMGSTPGFREGHPLANTLGNLEYQLIQLLNVFGQCLLQSDINIFRISLSSLEDLNVKIKLYQKKVFKERMLCEFLHVLLKTMVDKTHHLLNDDIMQAVYNMATVSFQEFFNSFLTQFIDTLDGLTTLQRRTLRNNAQYATDMPTFVQNLQRFVNEARAYRMRNSGIPRWSLF